MFICLEIIRYLVFSQNVIESLLVKSNSSDCSLGWKKISLLNRKYETLKTHSDENCLFSLLL